MSIRTQAAYFPKGAFIQDDFFFMQFHHRIFYPGFYCYIFEDSFISVVRHILSVSEYGYTMFLPNALEEGRQDFPVFGHIPLSSILSLPGLYLQNSRENQQVA
jgi:hypothetical protein